MWTVTNVVTISCSPTVNILPGTGTVCLGSSITLTATGGITYSWSTAATTSTINVLPTNTTPMVIYVAGTNASGCTDVDSMAVVAQNTCAMVWPGDANSDGAVSSTDVFELGLYSASTGAARSPGGNSWNAQFATAWTGSGSNGQNKAHVDCNGDGTVNLSDTLAIYNNFSLTHTFKTSSGAAVGDVYLVAPAVIPSNGNWAKIDIMLGSSANNMSNIYGVAFDLTFDNSKVDNNQVYINYTASFLNAGNINVPFRRIVPGSGLANCATVRQNGTNVSGNGKIGELVFKTIKGTQGQMSLAVTNVKRVNAGGVIANLAGSTANANIVNGLSEYGLQRAVSFYPNPAAGQLTLASASAEVINYSISDLTGRLVMYGSYHSKAVVDLSSLREGAYLINFSSEDENFTSKLIVVH